MTDRCSHDRGRLVVHEIPGAQDAKRVKETEFHAEPKQFLALVRAGQQVIVTDDLNQDKIVMVIGTNGVRIDVHDPELDSLPEEIESECDHIDYEAWLR